MISLRSYRRKIRSVKSLQQIFHAMKMISSVRLKRTKNAFAFASSYCQDLKNIVAALFYISKSKFAQSDIPLELKPYISTKNKEKICLVVITSDKGLCGSFNSNIVRASLEFVKQNEGKDIKVIAIGKKGRSVLARKLSILKEFENLSSLKYSDLKPLLGEVLDIYVKEGFSALYIAHSVFKSSILQKVTVEQFLPLPENVFSGPVVKVPDYICEPEADILLKFAVPLYIRSEFYKTLLDSSLSEHAARINSMETAITNSDDLIADMSLHMNKVRQERITSEISEVTANML